MRDCLHGGIHEMKRGNAIMKAKPDGPFFPSCYLLNNRFKFEMMSPETDAQKQPVTITKEKKGYSLMQVDMSKLKIYGVIQPKNVRNIKQIFTGSKLNAPVDISWL